jgi:hypothetical protein
MGLFSRFEGGIDNAVDKASGAVFKAPLEPAQVAKAAQKQMLAEKLVGTGRLYAPTLYTVLVNKSDDEHLFGFYPTMAAEIETFLMSKGADADLEFDGRPLVRFMVNDKLKRGKFNVIAEVVSAQIVEQLREEEREFYGIKDAPVAAPAVVAPAAAPVVPAAVPIANVPPVVAGDPFSGGRPQVAPTKGGARTNAEAAGTALLLEVAKGTVHQLVKSPSVIGRDSGSDIQVSDANASRAHARVATDGLGTWSVEDLGSTNGTLLNDQLVDQALLRDGDLLTIGVTVLEFRQ